MAPQPPAPNTPTNPPTAERLAEIEAENLALRQRVAMLEQLVRAEPDRAVIRAAEAAQRESEYRYRAVSEMMSDFVFEGLLHPDGTRETVWAAGAFSRIAGHAEGEMLARQDLARFVHPDDRDRYEAYTDALSTCEPQTIELRIVQPGGAIRWVRLSVRPEPIAGRPGVIRCIGAGRDVTEAKAAEVALRAEETRYRAAVDQQTELVCRMSYPGLRITFVNEAYAAFYGGGSSELIGRHLSELIPLESYLVAREQLLAITPERPSQVVEMVGPDHDGRPSWRQWSDTAVFDGEGRVVEIQSVGRDITALKRVEAELRQLNAELEARVAERTGALSRANAELHRGGVLLRTVLDSLIDGIALVQADSSILIANYGLGRLLGVDPAALVGRHWSSPTFPASELVHASASDRRPRTGRELFLDPEGRRHVLDIQVSPPDTDGSGADRLIVRLSDVTERLQLERLVIENERLAASGRLAAIAAHEINTPLQSVQNLIFLAIQTRGGGSDADELLALAGDEIGRVSAILRRLLNLSKMTDGTSTSASCNEVVERVLLLTGPTLTRKRIRLERRLEEPLPRVTLGGELITQVLLNLVVNAIDAMPTGGDLLVATGVLREGGVVITVRDTGVGIPPQEQQRIFEPFFSQKEGGHGLGLAVSRQIVHQSGGELLVESEPGRGTTFTVRLPVADGAP